ncbi:hypothetical protein [Roseicyclus marinus]|uniref:hypothetical protein n=1 Tax=Roseicyclus marinus TaxID=2161673 RepID=UPI002410A232|nr:hypothetical protein [Roseicyclus marinus]MDG3043071.1 hypothetical protein [Roseicyclus marinus]
MESRRVTRGIALAVVAFLGTVTMGQAQAVPAETPPSSYTGVQYVDSRGCVFVRVGVGANVEWVPRVGRDRRQICGQSPTRIAGTAPAAAPSVAAAPPAASRPATVAPAATVPRPVATAPRPVATTPRPMPTPVAPAAAGNCPNLPADIRPYFTGPGVRCGPQAVHPGDAARGLDQSSLGTTGGEVRQVVRYEVDPPPGYRAAWDDGRMNPYRGVFFAGGQRQMEQVWTNTVPRRLVSDPAPRGLMALFAQRSRPAEVIPAQLVVIRP